MTEQARFEAHMRKVRPMWTLKKYTCGTYREPRVDFAWEVWQEANQVKPSNITFEVKKS